MQKNTLILKESPLVNFYGKLHAFLQKKLSSIFLRTFAPIVPAHPYCARNSLRDVMPRHVLSARAVEEMWSYNIIARVGTLISVCTGLTLLNVR